MEHKVASPNAKPAGEVTQFLTFTLGDEEYGIEILRVQEIKGQTPLTPIPNAPAFMKGVMNLRGTVVPVIGLRETFGMAPSTYGRFSVIIVIAVGTKIVGLLVDAVAEVVDLAAEQIDVAPELGGRIDTSMVSGMGRHDEKFIILLAIDRVVAGADGVLDRASGGDEASEDGPEGGDVRAA